ncbi:MAG: DUF3592 domain-containing protein [Planctomycetes bacterium]|nr:DUF3592 domain-containing protein [Planctomycetota bacterium]
MWTGFMWMLIVCGTIQAALLVALIVYLWLLFATRHWLPADGMIVTSRVVSRGTESVRGADTEIARTPLVEYEYQANGKSFRGDRIMIGGANSESELESVLGQYPLGAKVIVYYNPADPQQAVLERFPARRLWGCGVLMLFPFGVPLAAIWIYNLAADWVSAAWIAEPWAFSVGVLGLAILAYAIVLTALSVRASAWPTTRGKIVLAHVAEFSTEDPGVSRFKPSVLFDYTVNGRHYRSGRVTMMVGFSSRISHLSRRTLAKYPEGTEVDVHYNPKWPAAAVLHPWSAGHLYPWLIAAVLFALAWRLMGLQ